MMLAKVGLLASLALLVAIIIYDYTTANNQQAGNGAQDGPPREAPLGALLQDESAEEPPAAAATHADLKED
jgi:hypothetical protein